MEKEFNLSKKGQEYNLTGGNYILFMEEDIKEFIKRLLEGLIIDPDKMDEFNKLAGEKLCQLDVGQCQEKNLNEI